VALAVGLAPEGVPPAPGVAVVTTVVVTPGVAAVFCVCVVVERVVDVLVPPDGPLPEHPTRDTSAPVAHNRAKNLTFLTLRNLLKL